MTTQLRVLLVVAVFAMLWSTGETCTVGALTADPEACNHYYRCTRSGAATIQIRKKCPPGKNFDPKTRHCKSKAACLICD